MFSTVIRTAVLFIFVTLGIRLMGKRQIGDMQPNELVVTLLISEIAAIPLQDMDQPILSGLVAIFMLVILEIIISVLSMKNFFVRKLMSGRSVVIIKNGVIDQHAMQNVRMTVLDLIELLRSQGVFDISEVNFAVLEVNGELSVLLNKENMPPTISDLNMKAEKEGMQLPIISDGKVISESLDALNITRADLNNLLSEEKIKVKDVFLMTLDRYQNFNIIRKRID